MKKSWGSKSQVNIILLLFCMESCCCVEVYRGSQDQIGFLYRQRNCEGVFHSFQEDFRCKCPVFRPSILSINTGKVQCLKDIDIDSSCTPTVLKVTNEAIEAAKITTISDCGSGNIFQTEFWNIRSNDSYGYWHNENDVKSYLTLNEDGFLLLNNTIDKFSGLFLRIKIECENARTECKLVKIDGFQEYPITRFAKSTEATSTSTIITTTTTTATTTKPKETAIPKSESVTNRMNPNISSTTKTTTSRSNIQKNKNSSEDRKTIIIIAAVAAVAILSIIILSMCHWKRTCRKQKGGQNNAAVSTERQNNHKSHPTYPETQKNDEFTDEYTTITFKSSPKPQYSELGLQYQDVKPVYSELSTDNQTFVDEPFYREVDETDRGEFPPPSNVIYHTVEEEIPTYEENDYYSAVETLPDEVPNPTAVYAKVNK